MIFHIFLQFEKADPKIGDVHYNVNFVFTFGGKTYEELGFITNDGLMVKIMGFMGYKTMEWVNEEEAAQIGKKLMANAKASPVILQYMYYLIQQKKQNKEIQQMPPHVLTSFSLIFKVIELNMIQDGVVVSSNIFSNEQGNCYG